MNQKVDGYLSQVEAFLLGSETIQSYRILRRQVSVTDGKFRFRVGFVDRSEAEFFIYILEVAGQLQLQKYSFHWQDSGGKLRRRWDNAPHYPHLPGVPHHIHYADGRVDGISKVPDLLAVLGEIEQELSE